MNIKQKWVMENGVFFPIPGDTTLHNTPGNGVFEVHVVKSMSGTRIGLKRIADKFTFNFKLYDLGIEEFFDRIQKTWNSAPLGKFWKWASANYKQVLIVPGNHEYYQGCDIMERGQQWRWMFKENVGYYQNQVARIDDTDFILSTLWSHIPPADEYFVSRGLNDFYQTKLNGKRLTTEEYNRMHTFCLDFIKKSVAESTAKHIVVVTHHLPTLKVVAMQR